MNSIQKNGENDKSLSEGLDKLSREYGLLEQDEPAELLDQAILNSAHRAVEKKPHWMKFGWLHGLTTAAVFVLAFSIILNQRDPVPDYEISKSNFETIRLQRQKVAKKQSDSLLEEQPKELSSEMAIKNDYRTDILQSSPVAAAPASAALENAPEEGAEQPLLEAQRSLYVRDDTRVKTNSELEQILQAIIKLKQSGNESWKTELESFKANYPDYPLPEELTD